MADIALSIQGLRKAFGAVVVSDDISLQVQHGELHALIGPNGAGKTSLIHQLAGTLASDSGQIIFAGEDVAHLGVAARVRRGIARSFQITSILPDFTVLENVALAVQARSGSSFRFIRPAAGETSVNSEALAALAEVGLVDRAGVRAGALSHGEKRLLELTLAIATAPKLLLLDEPLAGLGREESLANIALLAKLKTRYTIILVEHDISAVFALADRISVLVYGRIIATGSPAEITANAAVRAAYLGDEEIA